jgi:hypothetical protein
MFAPALGIAGIGTSSASSMNGMTSTPPTQPHMWAASINAIGPWLLIVSLLLVLGSLVPRRSLWRIFVAAAGGVLTYYAMYVQTDARLMPIGTVIGLALLVLTSVSPRQVNAVHQR